MNGAESDTGGTTGESRGSTTLRRLIAERERQRIGDPTGGLPAGPTKPPGIERAASTALARAAERAHRLAVLAGKVTHSAISLPELAELLPERALLAVVEGPREQLGVVAICPNLLASLIEMQALGRVTARPAVPRRATRTDAAISEDFVNGLLAELQHELRGQPEFPELAGFRYVTYLDDPRPLLLMLEDGRMSRLTLGFRIGAAGQREGVVLIAVPAPTVRQDPAPVAQLPSTPNPKAMAEPVEIAGTSLAAIVQDAPVTLTGVLCRRMMTLRTLRGLAPGATIPLPQNALDEARVETVAGQLLARGKLGEADGFHAIRLNPASRGSGNEGQDEDGAARKVMDEPDAFRVTDEAEPPPSRLRR